VSTGAQRPARQTLEGLVVRTESGYHRVLADGQIIVCRAPKKLLMGERTTTTAVVIGDRVRLELRKDGTGLIEEILARESELARGGAGGSRFRDVIAANLDLLVVVQSVREPDFNPARVDRFLVMAEAAEVPAVLCLNKVDLVDPREADSFARPYLEAGYRVVETSAKTGQRIQELRELITDKISAFLGPSGAGKSSLLNRIQPGLKLRTAEISEATGKGRHTTTTAELLRLTDGGYVADTPGLRELAFKDIAPEDVAWMFPEFRALTAECKFTNCTHREEPGCAVRQGLEEGRIDPTRYRSYRRIYEEMVEEGAY
jgi:ribosome biogenesis GTPase